MRAFMVGLCWWMLSVGLAEAQEAAALAKKAKAILKEHCYSCHGEGGAAEGGMNYVLDVSRLISRGKLVAKNSANSKLYTQVKTGNMPKDTAPLSKSDIESLQQWIDAGAPDFNPPLAKREFISSAKMFELMQADLETIDSRKRPMIRYFTLTHLYNAGRSNDELATYRNGLAKLINSLSWAPDIVVPKAIDPAKTIFRLDIGDVEWSTVTWDCIVAENPYGVTYATSSAMTCYRLCGTTQPFVRGDWFVARASIPPLYHDILDLPKTDLELEKKLQVDVQRNLQTDRAARAGFNGSGVSNNNRLVERHRSNLTRGAYWKSYDFAGNDGTKNLFKHPAGKNGRDTFSADGGELIFNLPNGLQGYMLIDAKGQRIDKGPINVVSDSKRPDKLVVNGLSCMNCHSKGMIEKDDQIRDVVLGNSNGYTAEVVASVQALYPPKAEFAKLVAQDKDRFAKAVAAIGIALGDTEPIVTIAVRFEELLDLTLAAAEADVSSEEFVKVLGSSFELASIFGALKVPGGTVQREVYQANFALVVRGLKLGQYVGKRVAPPQVKDSFNNTIGMTLKLIPAGEFLMGSSDAAVTVAVNAPGLTKISRKDLADEQPQHRVQITKSFYMAAHETTQAQYAQIMGTNPSSFCGAGAGSSKVKGQDTSRLPVETVSWFDAVEFCIKLSEKENRTPCYRLTNIERLNGSIKSASVAIINGDGYRLPTEAEREYACRAKSTTPFHFGTRLNGEEANVDGNYPFGTTTKGPHKEQTTTVGSYPANAFGLHDMHGNVWEWCQDFYDENYYAQCVERDPQGPRSGEYRVLRGGSWSNYARTALSARRNKYPPDHRNDDGGFRVVCVSSPALTD